MKRSPKQRRRFYRHPIQVPIRMELSSDNECGTSKSSNLSLGGMSFCWSTKLPRGSQIRMEIPVGEKNFDLNGRIIYSKENPREKNYRIGVSFTDFPSSFKARLAEEILRILEFQAKMRRELGQDFSEEQAAEQWIANYAHKFPKLS